MSPKNTSSASLLLLPEAFFRFFFVSCSRLFDQAASVAPWVSVFAAVHATDLCCFHCWLHIELLLLLLLVLLTL
jgi:hypothetical protein